MAQAEDAEDLFRIVAAQLQKVLQADRVVLYRFDGINIGTVIMESMVTGWASLMDIQEKDNSLKEDLMSSDRNSKSRNHFRHAKAV